MNTFYVAINIDLTIFSRFSKRATCQGRGKREWCCQWLRYDDGDDDDGDDDDDDSDDDGGDDNEDDDDDGDRDDDDDDGDNDGADDCDEDEDDAEDNDVGYDNEDDDDVSDENGDGDYYDVSGVDVSQDDDDDYGDLYNMVVWTLNRRRKRYIKGQRNSSWNPRNFPISGQLVKGKQKKTKSLPPDDGGMKPPETVVQ